MYTIHLDISYICLHVLSYTTSSLHIFVIQNSASGWSQGGAHPFLRWHCGERGTHRDLVLRNHHGNPKVPTPQCHPLSGNLGPKKRRGGGLLGFPWIQAAMIKVHLKMKAPRNRRFRTCKLSCWGSMLNYGAGRDMYIWAKILVVYLYVYSHLFIITYLYVYVAISCINTWGQIYTYYF